MSAGEAKATQAWLDECEEFIDTFHDPDRLTTCCPGPSAVQRCSDELLRGAADIAYKRKLPMHIHLAETKAQAVMGKRLYGTSLLQHLESLDILGPNLSMAHSIWIEDCGPRPFRQKRRDTSAQSCEQFAPRQWTGAGS